MNLLFPLLLSAVGLLSSCTVTAQPQTGNSDLIVRGKLLDHDLSADADLYIVKDGWHVKVGQVKSDETVQFTFTVQEARSWPTYTLEDLRVSARYANCNDSSLFIVDTKRASAPNVYVDVGGIRYRVEAGSERKENGRPVEGILDNISYSYSRGAVRGSLICNNRATTFYDMQLWPGWTVGRAYLAYDPAGVVTSRRFENYAPTSTLETTFHLRKAP